MLVTQTPHDVEDRHSQRCVDHRDRLVGDDQIRPDDVGTSHHQALALAATELMRILVKHLGGVQANDGESLVDRVCSRCPTVGEREVTENEIEDMADAIERIEDGVGILKDRLHVPPVDVLLLAMKPADVMAAKTNLA